MCVVESCFCESGSGSHWVCFHAHPEYFWGAGVGGWGFGISKMTVYWGAQEDAGSETT